MISTMMARAKLRQILSLMEDERTALTKGPLTALSEITEKRAFLLEAMENGGAVSKTVLGNGIIQIRDMAIRNKKLFEASMQGMHTATETLLQMEQNVTAMETYTQDGQKLLVQNQQGKKDHRV